MEPIIGNTVFLRTFDDADVDEFDRAVAESKTTLQRWLSWCHPHYSRADAEAWVLSRADSMASGGEHSFLICARDTQQILGGVGMTPVSVQHRIGNLGYWVRDSAQRGGVATEAAGLIARYGLESMALTRIEIVVLPDNTASRKVAEKTGAVYEGILKNRLVLHDQALDACMYTITP
jgi:RimJ/RimL family protein N-acetyltransferase